MARQNNSRLNLQSCSVFAFHAGGGNSCIFATSVGSDLLLLGIFGRPPNFCHNLENNFLIGQWFPKHPESYYQSTVGVASSPFTSESKMICLGKSDIFEPSKISASAEFQLLPQSSLMALLTPSYQESKIGWYCLAIGFGDCSVAGRQLFGSRFRWQIHDFRPFKNFQIHSAAMAWSVWPHSIVWKSEKRYPAIS